MPRICRELAAPLTSPCHIARRTPVRPAILLNGMASRMLIFLLIFAPKLGWAQPNSDAASLVAKAAHFAGTGVSWNTEGYITRKGVDGRRQQEHFRIAYSVTKPFGARLEITDGDNPMLRVCDGASQWTYYPKGNSYIRVLIGQIGPCAYPINAWPPLSLTMRSPRMAGTDKLTIDGQQRECQVIRGGFVGFANDPRRRVLTLCVDATTELILRYQMEEMSPNPGVQTVTFSSIQRDTRLNADLFQFRPPERSSEVAVMNWLDTIAQPSNSAIRADNQTSLPLLASMVPPESLRAAARKPSDCSVLLYTEIDGDGVPRNIRAVPPLGLVPEEKAIEAVKKWRFEPGIRKGRPVAVVTAISVNVCGP